MSAIQNILKLLLIFEEDSITYTATELAEKLHVSERQVRTYIQELREFGYAIDGRAVRGGGYKSSGQYIDIPLRITQEEILALGRTTEFIRENKVFEESDTLDLLYQKIMKTKKQKEPSKNSMDYQLLHGQIHTKNEKDLFKEVAEAIEKCEKIKIIYYSAKGRQEQERIIHPYKLQLYQGANYIHGYCEKAKDYRVFKLLRIEKLERMKQNFSRLNSIEKKLEKQNFGLFNEEAIQLKVQFFYPYNAFAKEVILSEQQEVKILDENTTEITATVNNETEIIRWLFSFGAGVKVIEPSKYAKLLQKMAKEVIEVYESRK